MSQLSNIFQTAIQSNFAPLLDTGSLFGSHGESVEENAFHPTIPLYGTFSYHQSDKDRSELAHMGPLPQDMACVRSFCERDNESASKSENMLPRASLDFHKGYIKSRLEKSAPDYVPSKQLFAEIKANGYRGAFNTLRVFLSSVRPSIPKEAFLHFHKSYLKKRAEEMPKGVLPQQLFEEIKAKGYQGTLNTVKVFLVAIQCKQGVPKKGSLGFHKDYLKKRLEESGTEWVSSNRLFEEIKANGYRGAFKTMQAFLTAIRKKDMPPEASFRFHREYLTKRVMEDGPKKIEARKLFEEIVVRGYRGSPTTLRKFLSSIRERKEKKPEASLGFHKGYIKNRLEKSATDCVSSTQLFEEIVVRGYRGSPTTLRRFLSSIREKKEKKPEAFLGFHAGYIKDRLEKSMPEYVSSTQLLIEITAKGYRESESTLQRFLSTIREKKKPEAFLGFHTGYIKDRLEKSAPEYVSSTQLLTEITAKGYRGSVSTLQKFLSTIREKGKFVGTSSQLA